MGLVAMIAIAKDRGIEVFELWEFGFDGAGEFDWQSTGLHRLFIGLQVCDAEKSKTIDSFPYVVRQWGTLGP